MGEPLDDWDRTLNLLPFMGTDQTHEAFAALVARVRELEKTAGWVRIVEERETLRARLVAAEEERDLYKLELDAADDALARLEAAERERDDYRNKYAELNGALCWDTTCLNCASLLDASYAEYVRADKAEGHLSALRDATTGLAAEVRQCESQYQWIAERLEGLSE